MGRTVFTLELRCTVAGSGGLWRLIEICFDLYFRVHKCRSYGPGSTVSIATDYGLDGPGSNPCGDEIFRPALRLTQPPVQWVGPAGSFPKVKCGRVVVLTTHPPSSAAVMEE